MSIREESAGVSIREEIKECLFYLLQKSIQSLIREESAAVSIREESAGVSFFLLEKRGRSFYFIY